MRLSTHGFVCAFGCTLAVFKIQQVVTDFYMGRYLMMNTVRMLAILLFMSAGSSFAGNLSATESNPGRNDRQNAKVMDERLKQQQGYLLKLHEMMHQIMDAKNDAERERLKEEQLELMRANMRLHQQKMRSHRGDGQDLRED